MNALEASDHLDNTAVPEQDTSTAFYAFLVQAFCAFLTYEAGKLMVLMVLTETIQKKNRKSSKR